ARHLQPHQQGCGVDEVEIVFGGRGPNKAVELVEGCVVLAELQPVERSMPVDVVYEPALLPPDGLMLAYPLQSFPRSALHLQDMGHGMSGPDVAFVDLDRPAARSFSRLIISGLLQAEGAAAEEIAETWNILVPARHDPRGGIPHRHDVADEEMQIVRDPERQNVARMIQEDVLQPVDRAAQITAAPGS